MTERKTALRVLVTGGSGFIGRHLVNHLLTRGDEVSVVDRNPFPNRDVPSVLGDVRDPAIIERAVVAGTDAVVHLAAMTSVLQSVNDPEAVFATNVAATSMLIERCRVLGIERFTFASTNAVAGNVGAQAIHEELPLHPLTPYGATKAAAEMLFSAYAASYGMKTVTLRFTNVYGVGMQTKDSIVARLMRAALSGGGIEVYGDGDQLRDYVYVSDAVRALELGLTLDQANTLTIGAGTSVSVNDLHRLTCEVTGVEIGVTHIPGKAGEMPAVVVDTSKATGIGFSPAYSVRDGLAATWEDFKATA